MDKNKRAMDYPQFHDFENGFALWLFLPQFKLIVHKTG
jgi:hypothetical protein